MQRAQPGGHRLQQTVTAGAGLTQDHMSKLKTELNTGATELPRVRRYADRAVARARELFGRRPLGGYPFLVLTIQYNILFLKQQWRSCKHYYVS